MESRGIQELVLLAIGLIWLIGGNIVFISSIRRQGLSFFELINPFFIFKLEAVDWKYLFLLCSLTFALSIIAFYSGVIV